ncbi:hypothetical protein [Amycolatopsis silviterrae]|uniref:Uncharacterized protein n=1 Tax=Amycolatopsis silviterrae TaxID=1656914 RepID=A0ABW5HKG6_9PSEU
MRFYELQVVKSSGGSDRVITANPDFWQKMGDYVGNLPSADRQVPIRGRSVYGEHRLATRPAQRYFYVGGVRERAEWPDGLSGATGIVGDLQPRDQSTVLIEPTYIVPFGVNNQVAVLTMSAASPRVTALESWFTAVHKRSDPAIAYMLTPVVNSRVAHRLGEAEGATVLRVTVKHGSDVPEAGGGHIGEAARAARSVSQETDIQLGWTLSHRTGDEQTKTALLEGARWVREDFVSKAEVNLVLADGDGFKRRKYDLLKQQFTAMEKFDIRSNERPSEFAVLTGVHQAIDAFRKEFS